MPIFVDTNVLVYARDDSETAKQARAREWMEVLWTGHSGRLSMQVLHEFYVTVTRKLRPGLSAEEARADVRDLFAWEPLALDAGVLEQAWQVEQRFGISFWDALVVAAAGRAGCEHILSEDLSDGADYGGVRIVDPFRHRPELLA